MSEPEEDDLDALPQGELLTLPDGAIPPGWLTEFFARRAALIHQQDSNELALELSGDSSLHLMIFRDMDPKEKRRREEDEDRRRLLAEQELLEYRDRSDRLLARIEQEQLVVEKHRKEVEDNAIKLHDGRRVYVDGNQYRDEQGRVLEGRDRDEAAVLHNQKPNASTWQDRQKTIEQADDLARLKQKVLNDRQEAERGGDVSAAGWIDSQPINFTVPPDAPEPIVIQPDFSTLGSGQYRAALTAAFDDGSIRNVSILAVVAPAGTLVGSAVTDRDRPLATSTCTATKLLPQFTATGLNSNLTVGYPASIAVTIHDDCTVPMTGGSVIVSFNNGDPPISLVSQQDGSWTNSWQPTYPTNSITLTLTATLLNLTGTAQANPGGVQQGSQGPPMLTGSPQGAGTRSAGPFAPGDLMLLKGTGLADGQASSSSTALKNQLAGASVVIGAETISLLYADAGQLVGLIPADAAPNSSPQLIVLRDNAVGVATPVIISTTHPAILTADGSGQGQGVIYKASGATTTAADSTNPVNPGDSIIIYCTGLGATNASGIASNTPTLTIGGMMVPVSYAGVALPANYPPSGAPTLLGLVSASLGGLYQINATVPTGLAGGPAQVLISSVGQTSQSGVTMMIAGSTSVATPTITSIDTAGGFPTVAQNGWIEIKGSNLAPAGVSSPDCPGYCWQASDFVNNQMPTALHGVSATVDGNPAYVYFISPTQINVLTPLDSATGSVQVVVNNDSALSTPFTITENAVAPSFLLFGTQGYIAATHLNNTGCAASGLVDCYVGPTMLYPGASTPAAPGETIVAYAVGFGLPSTTLTAGSETQSGSLPTLPSCKIGGNPAVVGFAGLISPGLYQFNITVPSTAANGDNVIICAYGGLSTPSGDLITVQK